MEEKECGWKGGKVGGGARVLVKELKKGLENRNVGISVNDEGVGRAVL